MLGFAPSSHTANLGASNDIAAVCHTGRTTTTGGGGRSKAETDLGSAGCVHASAGAMGSRFGTRAMRSAKLVSQSLPSASVTRPKHHGFGSCSLRPFVHRVS